MSSNPREYRQHLPDLALAIERATERTPDRSRYHVYLGEQLVASFRQLSEAQSRFYELRDESGWQPRNAAGLDPKEQLQRQREAEERYRQVEHWNRVSSRRGWFKGHRV